MRSSKVLKGEKGWPEVPLAKLQWGYISLWLAELALDVLGPTGALLKGAPGAIDGGMWARNYVWQRYTTIGAGPTEVQKNIIADPRSSSSANPPIRPGWSGDWARCRRLTICSRRGRSRRPRSARTVTRLRP